MPGKRECRGAKASRTGLAGLSPYSQRPRQRQHTYESRPCPLQYAGTLLDGCSRGHDIIDDHDPFADETATCPDCKGAAYVAYAGRRPEMALRGRLAAADQPIRRDNGPAGRVDGVSEHGRLIISSLKQPEPMQRNRHEEIRAGENVGSGAMHPAPERAGGVSAIAVLQPEHQMPAVLVIAQDRPRSIPATSLARTGRTERILPHRMSKGRPTERAPWRREKVNACPTPAAQAIGLADDFAAG